MDFILQLPRRCAVQYTSKSLLSVLIACYIFRLWYKHIQAIKNWALKWKAVSLRLSHRFDYFSYEDTSNMLHFEMSPIVWWRFEGRVTDERVIPYTVTLQSWSKSKLREKCTPRGLFILNNFPFTLKILENNFNIFIKYKYTILYYFYILIHNLIFIKFRFIQRRIL